MNLASSPFTGLEQPHECQVFPGTLTNSLSVSSKRQALILVLGMLATQPH
jgi:hypothetical protein